MKLNALNLFFLIGAILLTSSCEKQESKHRYEEISSPPSLVQSPSTQNDPQQLLKEMLARGEDPHALLQSSSTQADPHQLLKEMLARGEDPHAFMRDGQKGEDPHAFLQNNQMNKDMMQEVQLPPHISESPVLWNIPLGWVEKPGSGMRLASFASESYPGLDVSIVSLGGAAGGLSANINRWLNQIKLPEMKEESLDQFLNKQEKFASEGNLSVMLVDLTSLQIDADPAIPSILAGVVQGADSTIFVKMTGTIADINKNRDAFKALCRSLKNKE